MTNITDFSAIRFKNNYKEMIDGLSRDEAEKIYNELLNRNILKEVPL